MKRTQSILDMGDKKKRHVTKIVGEPCDPTSDISWHRHRMLEAMAQTPELSLCTSVPFETLKMSHNGTAWEIVLEAMVYTE